MNIGWILVGVVFLVVLGSAFYVGSKTSCKKCGSRVIFERKRKEVVPMINMGNVFLMEPTTYEIAERVCNNCGHTEQLYMRECEREQSPS
jgi:predicted nucleic-acid-binding Zn-ribbon protein